MNRKSDVKPVSMPELCLQPAIEPSTMPSIAPKMTDGISRTKVHFIL
ncbi:MAG: hypothetical protein A4E49_00114 [Methanosaeta sp. PtaU1.Bin112]|nr:MAG: hypothetical protein A4E49_00114 [Methanosaeta sp. PtaU1.Bin112]